MPSTMQPLTIYSKITHCLGRMTTLELYFNMRVRNFIKEMAVDNISTMIVRQWQLSGGQGEDTISS